MTKISAKKSQSFSQHLQQSSFFFVCFNLQSLYKNNADYHILKYHSFFHHNLLFEKRTSDIILLFSKTLAVSTY